MKTTYTTQNGTTFNAGDGATVHTGSDSHPYTVVGFSDNGHILYLRADNYKRTDDNGMSDCQEYEYTPNPTAGVASAYLDKRGYYKLGRRIVSLGVRRAYYDFSF
jgi:hypothetical protein